MHNLEIYPEFGSRLQCLGKEPRGLWCDAALPPNELVDALHRNAEVFRERHLSDAERLEKLPRQPLLDQWIARLSLFLEIDPKRIGRIGGGRRRVILRETGFELPDCEHEVPVQRIYRTLACEAQRNDLILNDVIGSLEEGRSAIALTGRKDHLDLLADRLRGFCRHLVVLRGGASAKRRREIAAVLEAIPDGEERLILATGRYIGEGFDGARLDTPFLTLPVSWRGTVVRAVRFCGVA